MESRRKRVEDHENQLQTLRVQDAEEYNMVKIKLETDVQVGYIVIWITLTGLSRSYWRRRAETLASVFSVTGYIHTYIIWLNGKFLLLFHLGYRFWNSSYSR